MNKWIIISGNVGDGLDFIGPFDTAEEANEYTFNDRDLEHENFVIAPLHLPAR